MISSFSLELHSDLFQWLSDLDDLFTRRLIDY